MSTYSVTRRLEIDAAHRIAEHGSKCRHLHGHRYAIEARCETNRLHDSGEQRGMVLDFGFLKEAMLRIIDTPCDHGLMVSVDDEALLRTLGPEQPEALVAWLDTVRDIVRKQGFMETTDQRLHGRLYILPGPPTAEVLAQHWFERLQDAVSNASDGLARLAEVTVWETPNCYARYTP